MRFEVTTMTTRPILLAAALTLAAGCPSRPQAPLPAPPPATVTLFTVEPAVVSAPGETVVLQWGTANASDVTIEQVGVGPLDLGAEKNGGKLPVTVAGDTIFLITAQGAGGSDIRASSVTVQRRARSVLFSAVPSTVEAGAATTLVWNAAGASAVRLEEVGGAAIDVGTQLESGSVRVTPKRSTTYRLQADAVSATTQVTVAPTILSFSAGGAVPAAGEPVELRWETASATAITLRRIGLATPLAVPAGQVATGRFTDTVPANLPADAVLTYVLDATDGSATVSKALEVPVGGGVRINTFTAPSYALTGSTYQVAWTTVGGESAELIVDGRRAYLAQSQAEVASGSYALSAPSQSTRVELIVRNGRGAEAREARTIEGVGPIAYNFFRADKTSIPAAGEPVTLQWSVTNARNIRITNNMGGGFYRQFTGLVDSGALVVLPNSRPPGLTRIVYRLEADNGTGAAPFVRTVEVDVGAPSAFVFSRQLPIRAPTTVTGTTLGTTTGVAGFKNVEKNPAGEAFVDIRRTGTPVTFAATANATNVLLPAAFEGTLFGTRYSRTRLNVTRFGWFNLTTSTTAVPGRPDNDPTFGTALEPLTVAPYWANLVTASDQVHWRIDAVADARRLIVQWTDVRPTNGPVDARLTFQAQLYSNGRVVLAYRDFFKVQGAGTAGVVNNSESDETGPTMPVAGGDVYRLFGPQPVPAPLRIEATPYAGRALINGDPMEAEGQANYPTNQFNVSEVFYKPVPAVTNGHWIEINNNVDAGVDLGGWTVDYGGGQSWDIPMGTILPPLGRLVLAQAADLGDPDGPGGGLTLLDGGVIPRPAPAALFPSTLVPPAMGAFVRIGIGGTEYTRFPSAAALPDIAVGRSYQLEDERLPYLTYASATTRFLCPAVRPAYGTNGQYGSPGGLNASCWPYRQQVGASRPFTSLAGVGTPVPLVATFPPDPAFDEGLYVLRLTRPIRPFGFFETTELTLSSNGFVVPYPYTAALHGGNKSAPSTTAPTFVIAPFWDDLDGSNNPGAQMYYLVELNGDVTVSWENWSVWSTTLATDLSFQVVLRADGDIEFRYGSMTGSGGTAPATGSNRALGSSATTWIDVGSAAQIVNVNSVVPGIQPNSGFLFERYR